MTDAETIVLAALRRGMGARPPLRPHRLGDALAIVCETPGASALEPAPRGKILVFGMPPAHMLPLLGLRADPALPPLAGLDEAPPAAGEPPHTESPAYLAYAEHALLDSLSSALRRRPFTRHDYADEWNNLGFGRIRTDGSLWAARGGVTPDGALELAGIFSHDASGEYHGSYLTLHDTREASALWCARPVGPVDSVEWSIVERFISDWRAGDMPCLPCLCQTPAGCRCLVTMRLDCDENIGSARALFDLYSGLHVPFSLAITTGLDATPADLRLLDDVRAAGGTLLSHSHTHQRDWGADFERALAEAETSRRWFARRWPELPPTDLAVSPFHTNPPHAVRALARAGFTGFVSGIIRNDPEYLLGRAGVVPYADGIVGISQQSMLHGDVYRRQGRRVDTHLAAFEAQYAAGGIFGYLDHPFSARYQYDWASEEERIRAHRTLIGAIRRHEGVWFWSQRQCFDFVRALAAVRFQTDPDGEVSAQLPAANAFGIRYRYRGRETVMNAEPPPVAASCPESPQ